MKRNQWNRWTMSMELLNEINGIVQQNQWNGLLEMTFSVREIGVLNEKEQRFSSTYV